MDCCFSLCIHCLPHHHSHSLLQIRRYMYNDVLRLKDAHKIFDCSLIQSYTTNSEKVVLLRPRQRVPCPIRGSRCTCLVCKQNIKASFVYCSIACKFSHVTPSASGGESYDSKDPCLPAVSANSNAESMESSVEENSTIATAGVDYESSPFVHQQKKSTRKQHGRKCVPQRSPLF